MPQNNQRFNASLFFLVINLFICGEVPAAVTSEQLRQLDSNLTPLGAERKGNQEGTVPEWSGDKDNVKELAANVLDESPSVMITANNYGEFKHYLSNGHKALFENYPDTFQMPVFPSRRLHNAPQWLYDSTRKNGAETTLIDNGNGITNVWPGIPFPIPANALEVLWNHLTAWRGVYASSPFIEATIQPNGTSSIIKNRVELAMPYYEKKRDKIKGNSILTYYLTLTIYPTRLAGGALLVHDPLNPTLDSRKVWIYNAGQRRIRRLPSLDYDTPNMNSEHIRVVDEINLFNGSPDRYDWELLGKREIYIPYNSNKLARQAQGFDSLLKPHHIPPEITRYELHRVWVVEGKLKKGKRHIYPRRVLYIDEDSWMVVVAEQYGRDDQLWRVSLSHTRYYPELPGVMLVMYAYHDLKKKTHYIQFVIDEDKDEIQFSETLPSKKYFSPASLRRKVKR